MDAFLRIAWGLTGVVMLVFAALHGFHERYPQATFCMLYAIYAALQEQRMELRTRL